MRSRTRAALLIGLAVAVCAGLLTGVASGAASAGGTVRIGLEGPLSGDQKNIGIGMLDGARLAAAQLNARGGLLGKRVQIVPIDDAADPTTGVQAATAAIKAGLDGVVGPYNSGVGAKTLPLYLAAGIVPIRLTSADATAGLGFTLQPMTSQIAPVAAEALTNWVGAKSVAIVYDSTQLYTQTVSTALKSLLEQAGVTVTAYQPIEPGKKSYADVVSSVAASKPDVIYAATYYPEGGLIAKAMHQQQVSSRCIADYGSYDTAFVTTAGNGSREAMPGRRRAGPDRLRELRGVCRVVPQEVRASTRHMEPVCIRLGELPCLRRERKRMVSPRAALTSELGKVHGWSGWTGYVTIEASTGNRQPATVVVTTTDANGQLHVDRAWAKAAGVHPSS